MLENITSPKDIKDFSTDRLNELATEIRKEIVSVVSANGGHLASNLGMVEATLAIEKVFDTPNDTVLFDVGHQCYTHKLITGRYKSFATLRKFGGISGFTNPTESEYDTFYAGHCGSSISEGLGLAAAKKLMNDESYTICVVGDGAFTNGMIYEALNNCTDRDLKLIIILNDNGMSISKNVGRVSLSLAGFRTSRSYFSFKRKLKRNLMNIPLVGDNIKSFLTKTRDLIRRVLVKDNLFETIGLDYLGPVNGNNIDNLITVLNEAKQKNGLCLVHITTEKGLGYSPASLDPTNYHSTSAFDPRYGLKPAVTMSFSSVFGDIMLDSAKYDEKVCAITAAMCTGTGLDEFSKIYPEKFFDVGIAEEHAVAFSGALAKKGLKPVCAIYSTFIQRCYDQLFHDIALQGVNVVFALDRCGFVDADGPTHQGIYDVAMISSIPSASIYSPETYFEMERCFNFAFNDTGISCVRYNKGKQIEYDKSAFTDIGDYLSMFEIGKNGKDITLITYGRLTKNVFDAAVTLSKNYKIKLIKLIKIYPLNYNELFGLCKDSSLIYFAEESVDSGSISEKTAAAFAKSDMLKDTVYRTKTVPNSFLPTASVDELYALCGLDDKSITEDINKIMEKL